MGKRKVSQEEHVMIKFGVMIMPQHPRTDSPIKRFRETVELTRLARDAGLDSIACGHHFLSPPYQNLQSIPLMARLAADSGTMDIILSILLLPLYSPVQVAEDVASLDVMSEGRVVFGVGLGYRDIEYEAFNTARRERTGRFMESLELIRRLWTEEEVTFAGKHFHLTKATCTIRPVQKPYPRIWIAANNDAAIARAGRLGCAWFLNPHATLTTLERQMRVYKEALAATGQPVPADVPIIKEMHVAKTREEAIRVAQPYLEPKYQAYADWGQDKALPGQESFRVSFAALAKDRFILGSVDEVIQQIEEHGRRLGANHFIFRIWWPGMEAYHAYRVVELLGTDVIPHFRS
jgi:alkanesulfonate monooxygenase SsuD/methylene tetrahydromethanopterin reductase-like flavin-dependent oxidoreductase (luciferase family)